MRGKGLLLLWMLLAGAARGETPAAPVSSPAATGVQAGQYFDVRLEKTGTTLPAQVLDLRQDALFGDLLLLRVCWEVDRPATASDGGKKPEMVTVPYEFLVERSTFALWQKTPGTTGPCPVKPDEARSRAETRRLLDGGWLRVVDGGFERILTIARGRPAEDAK